MPDFRVNTGFFKHVKTKRLRRAVGLDGVLALMELWAYSAENKYTGSKALTREDIELITDWDGDGDLVGVLAEVGYLDEVDGGYVIHQWGEHNGFAATAEQREEQARNAANVRWEKKRSKKQDDIPSDANSNAASTNEHIPSDANSNAPSPSPSPSPLPKKTDLVEHARPRAASPPKKAADDPMAEQRFDVFWGKYPRKVNRKKALAVWKRNRCWNGDFGAIMAGLSAHLAADQWQRDGGRYIPHPASWLEGERWRDEIACPVQQGQKIGGLTF